MKEYFIRIAKLHPYIAIIFYGVLTLRNIIRFKFFKTNLKTGHRKNNASNIFNYIKFCNQSILKHLPTGMRKGFALEVGPGDNNALALSMLCHGFDKIELVDRYQLLNNDHDNYCLYDKICRQFNLDFNPENYCKRIVRLTELKFKQNEYNLIYSVSVLEHLWPFQEILKLYASNLSENGIMIHVVNFTDHGMFSPQSNRFYFRKIQKWIYDPIMSHVGRPNRILPSEMCEMISKLGFKVKLHVIRTHTAVLNVGEEYNVNSIPNDELNELLQSNPSIKNCIDSICDQAIGSAIIVAYR